MQKLFFHQLCNARIEVEGGHGCIGVMMKTACRIDSRVFDSQIWEEGRLRQPILVTCSIQELRFERFVSLSGFLEECCYSMLHLIHPVC